MRGAFASTISSKKIACSISVAPRPPYSFGQFTAAQPPSCSFACQSRANWKPSSSPDGPSPGWFAFEPLAQLVAKGLLAR